MDTTNSDKNKSHEFSSSNINKAAPDTEELVYEPIPETVVTIQIGEGQIELTEKNVEKQQQNKKIMTDDDAVQAAKKLVTDPRKEHFIGLYLDGRKNLVHSEVLSIGILNEAHAHPRETFRPAIEHSAYSMIVLHNHPYAETKPSEADFEVTERLSHVAELIGIHLDDHIIFNEDGESCSLRRHYQMLAMKSDDRAHHDHKAEPQTREQMLAAVKKALDKYVGKNTETHKNRESKAKKIIEKYAALIDKKPSREQDKRIEPERDL